MNREQAIALLKILKTAYQRFYADMTREEAENTINLWVDMFAHEDPQLVINATKDLINSFKYPPTIADVKERMYKITHANEDDNMEMWNAIKRAIRNSSYNSVEEFERLPDMCKKFVGTPMQLREWAIDPEYNDGVIKGQFLKQVEILKQRKKDDNMMLPSTKAFIAQLAEQLDNDIKYLN